MNKSAIEFKESAYDNMRNVVCRYSQPISKLPNLYIGIVSTTATSSIISMKEFANRYESQIITLKKDEETIKVTEIPHPFPTTSLEDFLGKHLSSEDRKLMWESFKNDLWQEVVDRKISKIKYYRIINRLTQKALARKLNTQQPNIARVEKLGYIPDIPTLRKLGEVFSIDYKELL